MKSVLYFLVFVAITSTSPQSSQFETQKMRPQHLARIPDVQDFVHDFTKEHAVKDFVDDFKKHAENVVGDNDKNWKKRLAKLTAKYVNKIEEKAERSTTPVKSGPTQVVAQKSSVLDKIKEHSKDVKENEGTKGKSEAVKKVLEKAKEKKNDEAEAPKAKGAADPKGVQKKSTEDSKNTETTAEPINQVFHIHINAEANHEGQKEAEALKTASKKGDAPETTAEAFQIHIKAEVKQIETTAEPGAAKTVSKKTQVEKKRDAPETTAEAFQIHINAEMKHEVQKEGEKKGSAPETTAEVVQIHVKAEVKHEGQKEAEAPKTTATKKTQVEKDGEATKTTAEAKKEEAPKKDASATSAPKEGKIPSAKSTQKADPGKQHVKEAPKTTSAAKKTPETTKATTTSKPSLVTKEFHFEGDFAKIVGNSKDKFLLECEEYVKPCACTDVFSGSVVVVIQGPVVSMQGVTSRLTSSGLKLPSFEPLKKLSKSPVTKDSSESAETKMPEGMDEVEFECNEPDCEVEKKLKVAPDSRIEVYIVQTDTDASNAFIQMHVDGQKERTCTPPEGTKCGDVYVCAKGTVDSTTHETTMKLKAFSQIKQRCDGMESVVSGKVRYFPPKSKAKTGGARIILFKGVFADAIDDKAKFLEECSQLDGISCVDVDADKESDTSIALSIEGSTKDIENAEKSFKREGLDLPSFQKLQLDDSAPFPFKNPSPECVDSPYVSDENGHDTGHSCAEAWGKVQKLLPTAKANGCPEKLASQCPKTCGTCGAETESTIPSLISVTQKQQLNRLIGTVGLKWKLCYDTKAHGGDAAEFRKRCEDEGPSVTIIRTVKGKIIGGYNPVSWHGMKCDPNAHNSVCYAKHQRTFLFQAHGMEKYELQRPKYAIRDEKGKHPIFGGGHDLFINPDATRISCNLGYSYKCAKKEGKALKGQSCHAEFCGANRIKIENYQVWILIGGVPDGEGKPDASGTKQSSKNSDGTGFDCCEISGMFGKVKGQKWRQDPPEKMRKWWEENNCEEIVEDKCKVETRVYKSKVGCEPVSKNLMDPQPDTSCDGEAKCNEAGEAQCDALPKCAAFSSSAGSNKWKPQYYGKVDCSNKKGSKVKFAIKQPAGAKAPQKKDDHKAKSDDNHVTKNVGNVAKKADAKEKASEYEVKEGCVPPESALFIYENVPKCDGKNACVELGKKQCDANEDCFSFAVSKKHGNFKPQFYLDDVCTHNDDWTFYVKKDSAVSAKTSGYVLIGTGWCEDSAGNYFSWKSNCGVMDGCPANTLESCAQRCDDFEECIGFQFGEEMCHTKNGNSNSCRLLAHDRQLGAIEKDFCGPSKPEKRVKDSVDKTQKGMLPIAKASYGKETALHCFAKKVQENNEWKLVAVGACGKHDNYKNDVKSLSKCTDLCVSDEECEMVSFSANKKRCGLHKGAYEGPQKWSEGAGFECFGSPENGTKNTAKADPEDSKSDGKKSQSNSDGRPDSKSHQSGSKKDSPKPTPVEKTYVFEGDFSKKIGDSRKGKFMKECSALFHPCECKTVKGVHKTIEVTISCPYSMKEVDQSIDAAGLELSSFDTLKVVTDDAPEPTSPAKLPPKKGEKSEQDHGKESKKKDSKTSKDAAQKEADANLEACPMGLRDVHSCRLMCIREGYKVGRFHHTGKCECRNTVPHKDECPKESKAGHAMVKDTPVSKQRICAYDVCIVKSSSASKKDDSLFGEESKPVLDPNAYHKNPFHDDPMQGPCCVGNVASCLACQAHKETQDFCAEKGHEKVEGCEFAKSKQKCKDVPYVKNRKGKETKLNCQQAYDDIVKNVDPFMTECPKFLGAQCPKICGICFSTEEETIQAADVERSFTKPLLLLSTGMAVLTLGMYRGCYDKLHDDGDTYYMSLIGEDLDGISDYWE